MSEYGKVIDCKSLSENIRKRIADEVLYLKNKGIIPTLAVVLVGNNKASEVYVNAKEKVCKALGILSKKIVVQDNISQNQLIETITMLNNDKSVNAILVQLPLPSHIDVQTITSAITPEKDVDVFNPLNVGKIQSSYNTDLLPCTPKACLKVLDSINCSIIGQFCIVVGKSNIVGKPMANILLQREGTVCVCHSHTVNLKKYCQQADILIVAAGSPNLITENMVKPGVVILDVGINRVDGKICGDVDFENVSKKSSYITPVPGGIGVMTVTMLMENTILLTKQQHC